MTAITFDGVRLAIDYTDRDFLSIVVSSRQLVTDRFPDITDFNTASAVEMIIELFAATFDRLMFMQDRQAGETNILTARRRRNVINRALAIAYAPGTATAATGTILATIPSALTGTLTIPAGTLIFTKESDDPQPFRITQDIVFAPGETQKSGPIKNSLIFEDSFTADGTPGQEFLFEESGYLNDGSTIVENNAIVWTQVDDFLGSAGTDTHYVVQVNEEDQPNFLFGDSINGAIPSGDVDITIETGGGKIGNQTSNAITEGPTTFTSSLSEDVRVTFTNPNPTTGGDDREDTELIRIRAPRNLSSVKRTVTRKDFQVNVEDGVTGVDRAIAFSSDQDPLIPENHVYVYVVPSVRDPFTTTMNNTMATTLNNGAVLDNGDNSMIVDNVGGISPGNELLIDDGTNSTTITVSVVSTISNAVVFTAPITGLAAPITDGADVTKAVTDLVNGDESVILTSLTGLFAGSVLEFDDGVNVTSALVDSVDTVSSSVRFDSPISGLAAPITDGANATRTNNGEPSPTLKDDVEAFLTTVDGKPIPLTMDLSIFSAIYLDTTLKAQVYIDNDKSFDVVKGLVIENLTNFFAFTTRELANPLDYTIDFGKVVRWSRVVDEIQKVDGVLHVQNFELNNVGPSTDLQPLEKEIPWLDPSNFDTPYSSDGLEFIQVV